jgi:hypothetical protein
VYTFYVLRGALRFLVKFFLLKKKTNKSLSNHTSRKMKLWVLEKKERKAKHKPCCGHRRHEKGGMRERA